MAVAAATAAEWRLWRRQLRRLWLLRRLSGVCGGGGRGCCSWAGARPSPRHFQRRRPPGAARGRAGRGAPGSGARPGPRRPSPLRPHPPPHQLGPLRRARGAPRLGATAGPDARPLARPRTGGRGRRLVISRFLSCSSALGSVLTARSLEPASDSVSPSLSAPPLLGCLSKMIKHQKKFRGAWVAPSVERPTWAQVMISQFVSLSPASGSVQTAGSLEPASDPVSPSLSLPLPAHAPSLSLKNEYTLKKFFLIKKNRGCFFCLQ